MCSHRRWLKRLEISDLGTSSFAVTGKLIWVFVLAYAKNCFSHDAAHIVHIVAAWEASEYDGLFFLEAAIQSATQLYKEITVTLKIAVELHQNFISKAALQDLGSQ